MNFHTVTWLAPNVELNALCHPSTALFVLGEPCITASNIFHILIEKVGALRLPPRVSLPIHVSSK